MIQKNKSVPFFAPSGMERLASPAFAPPLMQAETVRRGCFQGLSAQGDNPKILFTFLLRSVAGYRSERRSFMGVIR
jgi:hypothetical protein